MHTKMHIKPCNKATPVHQKLEITVGMLVNNFQESMDGYKCLIVGRVIFNVEVNK